MRSGNFTDEFKRDAVAQITERGYPVAETAPASLAAPSEPPTTSHSRRKRSDVTIELGRGRRVRVDSDIDTEALGRILDCVLGRR